MDDFINPFLSPPTWPDNARSSWNGAVVSQTSNLLADSVEAYGEDQKDPSLCLASSTDVIGIAAAEDLNLHRHDGASSIFITRNLTYDIGKHQYPVERSSQNNLHTSQINSGTHDRSFNIHSGGGCNLAVKSFESALPHSALVISSSIESNISELSDFPQPLGDAHSIISIPTMWPPSYSIVSSFIGQGKLQATGFQGVESDDKILKKTCLENEKFRHLDGLPTASIRLKGNNDIHDPYYPSFTSGQQINLTTGTLQPPKEENGLHNLHLSSFPSGTQTVSSRMTGMQDSQKSPSSLSHTTGNQISGSQSQPVNANTSGCNGAVKPRVRARRGQATDPHSIAERLRRERIAERMKNLQELVPNSNKTDKASMLDEIIDYVKFLQLQVKVLSMSRLGAAGAVVPLLTDAQAEDYSSLLLGSSAEQGPIELSESENNLAFEQELVKLMESNLAAAMQYLQNKGLCLMPIALAAAISNQKASSTAIPSDCRKPCVTHVTIPRSSQEYLERENVCAEEGHNGHNATVPKQEAARRPINNQRELKSQCKIAS